MAMADFIENIHHVAHRVMAAKEPESRLVGGDLWLVPTTVSDFSEADFSKLSEQHRRELRSAVEEFRTIATSRPHVTREQIGTARAAFDRIYTIVTPYFDPESTKVRHAILDAWRNYTAWIPTFDYQLDLDWTGEPAVRVWLILADGVNVRDPETRIRLDEVSQAVEQNLHAAGVERWPFISVRGFSEVKELMEEVAV